VKIATWNVNGIRARQEDVLAWLERDAPDLVCLQETKAPREKVPAALLDLEGYWGYWHGFKGYSGVALLVRKTLAPEIPKFVHPHFDMENRIVTATVQGLTIASIYVPNGGTNFSGKMKFLTEMEAFAKNARRAKQALVLCGDFNVAHTPMDVHPKERAACTGQLPEERAILDGILAQGLVDLGRVMAPHDDQLFTWWAPWREMRKRNIGWRLDYVYASERMAKAATSCVVEKDTGTSDHGPVVATFDAKRAGMTIHREAAVSTPHKSVARLQQPDLGL
jgi:exodeoxyribonuclease-3